MSIKEWKPKFIENSRIPVWLSKIAPIEISAISVAFWVFSRGELSPTTRRHETIHFQQQLELLLVGQWILYGLFWLVGLVRYRSGSKAYRQNPFEREAYDNQRKFTYLVKRRRYAWVHYIRSLWNEAA
jgi:hypothetical protein